MGENASSSPGKLYATKPGAQDNATVQLSTGTVAIPVNLFSLSGPNGLNFDVTIHYSSGGVRKAVQTLNSDAPTGLLGLSWELSHEAVVRNASGTGSTLDDVFYLFTSGGVHMLVKVSSGSDGDVYECENYSFWQIRYIRDRELWIVTKENGDRYSYGGELSASPQRSKSSVGNSIEWAVKWRNWTGPSNVSAAQQQFPRIWNLASIESIAGERIGFEYDQTQVLTGTLESPHRRPFTKSCRLQRVVGPRGEAIVFSYEDKDINEYPRPHGQQAAPQSVCQIVGELVASGDWDPVGDPDPSLTVRVKGAGGFEQTFPKKATWTSSLSFTFDLKPDAPDMLEVSVDAKDVDPVGGDDTMVSHVFSDVTANAGIYQKGTRQGSKIAAIKLRYVKQTPSGAAGADPYQTRQETHYLAAVELWNAEGRKAERVEFGYRFLGSDTTRKRLLTRIARTILTKDGSYRAPRPDHLFEYYGEAQEDGVSGVVSRDTNTPNRAPGYDYKLFNAANGALFGALKSVVSPEGARTSYRYQELSIDQARRDLEIKRPDHDSADWHAPQTYFGGDYVVVIWMGRNGKLGRIHLTAYRWHGRWIPAEIPVAVSGPFQVEVTPDFFAIVEPGQGESVHLFTPSKLQPALWEKASHDFVIGLDVLVASGRDFLVVLDKASGRLMTFTHDGSAWAAEELPTMSAGANTVLALTAQDNFLVTANARSDNSRLPEVRISYHDETMKWSHTSLNPEHFFEKSGHDWRAERRDNEKWRVTSHGLKGIELFAGSTFVLLKAQAEVVNHVDMVSDENYDVYRHFIYRWPEDFSKIEVDFEPCLDISNDLPWECIKRDNTEIVVGQGYGGVRASVIGDQVVIDVWESIPTRMKVIAVQKSPKQKRFAYRYSGLGWHEKIFDNDALHNNYLGPDSLSSTHNGIAKYWDYSLETADWQSRLPSYKDGNPGLFQKTIWPAIRLVGGILALPLDWGPGLLVEALILSLDLFIEGMARPGGAAGGTDEFFTANFGNAEDPDNRQNNLVYRRRSSGAWESIGDLAPETSQAPSLVEQFESYSVYQRFQMNYQSTQYLEAAIAYTLKEDRWGVANHPEGEGSGDSSPPKIEGFPAYSTRVKLLKNGRFLSTIILDKGELLKHGPDDTHRLSSHNCLLSFKGGTRLSDATALRLYRLVDDDIRGPLTDVVVSLVTVNDGFGDTHTHYSYDTSSACALPTGAGALYTKVTATYNGASSTADKRYGFTESHFHGDAWSIFQGLRYQTSAFDPTGTEVSSSTWRWQGFKKEFTHMGTERSRSGHFVRAVAEFSKIDGASSCRETDYCIGSATPFDIRQGDRLPLVLLGVAEIKGADGWHVDGNARLAHSSRGVSSRGSEPWQSAIGPLTIDGSRFGSLRFQYELSTVADARGTASFEAWTAGALIWSDERAVRNGGFTDSAVVSIGFHDGPLELRVSCRLHGADMDVHVTIYNLQVQETAIGTPSEVRTVHYDAAGDVVKTVEERTSAWQKYPSLLARNVLTPVAESRTTTNGILTAASAATWEPVKGAGEATDVAQRWMPAATHHARRATGLFDFAQPKRNPDWLTDSAVVARNAQYAVVTETEDVDGLVHAVVYDKRHRLPVARFVHASIQRHEAGYHGFEDYEQTEHWVISGSREAEGHAGTAALSGASARIEPKRFVPRSAKTPYVVSAWLKPRRGGTGGQIGFGSRTKEITATGDEWQYVELVVAAAGEGQMPFARCDGAIDDFRFGPLDAPFDATVYDGTHFGVTDRIDSNGGMVRQIVDHLQRPFATVGPDGQVVELRSERFSRMGTQAFDARLPNQTLAILPRQGGHYYKDFAEYAGRTGERDRALRSEGGSSKGLRFALVPPTRAAPASPSNFVVRIGAASISGAISWEAGSGGISPEPGGETDGLLLNWSGMTMSVVGAPAGVGNGSRFGTKMGCTILLLLIDTHVYCFLDGGLAAHGTLASGPPGGLSLEWIPSGDTALVDLVTFYEPAVNLSFSDGLGRVIQSQHLADHGAEAIAVQTLYDGWGRAALQTKPVPIGPGLAYQHDLVSDFDWALGVMTGVVVGYYGGAETRTLDQRSDDHLYPYARQVAESNPLARLIETGFPGSEFKPGAPHALKRSFGWTTEAGRLLADLDPLALSQHYTALTTYRALDATHQTSSVQIFDLGGRRIAHCEGSRPGAVISSYGVRYAQDETVLTQKLPNAFSSDPAEGRDRQVSTSVVDFRGLPKQSSDGDRGARHYVHDKAGRLRFRLDAAGAAQKLNRILYWKYDALGRVIEAGEMPWKWNEHELQTVAESDPTWPNTSAVTGSGQDNNPAVPSPAYSTGVPSWPMYGHDSRNTRQCPVVVAAPKASYPDSDVEGIDWYGSGKEAPYSVLMSQIFVGSSGRLFFIERSESYPPGRVVTQGPWLAVVDPRTGLKQRFGDPATGLDIGGGKVNDAMLIILTADETVYFLSGLGELCCLKSGEQSVTKINIDGDNPTPGRTLSLGPDRCIYLTSDKDVVVVEPDGRKRRHEHIGAAPGEMPPTAAPGQLPAIAEDGTVVTVVEARDAWSASGDTRCYLLRIAPDGSHQRIYLRALDSRHHLNRAVPLMIARSGTVYVYLVDTLIAVQEDTVIWSKHLEKVSDMALDGDGTLILAIDNGFIGPNGQSGSIRALNGNTGQDIWSRGIQFSGVGDPIHLVLGGEGVLYCGQGRELMAFAPSTGDLKWNVRALQKISYPLSISTDGLLLAPAATGFYSIGSRSASASAIWRKRYFYESGPNGSANLKGRLGRAVIRDEDGKVTEETYEYDPYGRPSSVALRVPDFDDDVRTTTYRYDAQGHVVEIGYPRPTPGRSAIGSVRYSYTAAGRIAGIGTADDPTCYAAYEYNVDGSIKSERRNRGSLRCDYGYDFQGRLLSIEDRSPDQQSRFQETLSYRDPSGSFKDGNITRATFTGSALKVPHRYDYEFDEHGRLLSAKAAALRPGNPLPGSWDVSGIGDKPIGYDANGNIVAITQRGTAREYFYEPGTDRLAGIDEPQETRMFGFEPREEGRFHADRARHGQFAEGDWYGPVSRLTTKDKHSGTRSLQLGYVLSNYLRVSTRAARYIFQAWVKNTMPNKTKSVDMMIMRGGRPLTYVSIGPTGGEWRRFECILENKDLEPGTVLEAELHNQMGVLDDRFPVYVDDLFFGIVPADCHYDASGYLIQSDRLARLRYDSLTGLPREIQARSKDGDAQRDLTVKLRYGPHGNRVFKESVARESPEGTGAQVNKEVVNTTLYVHGANSYPLLEEGRLSRDGARLESGTGWAADRRYIYGVGGLVAIADGTNTYFICKDHLGSLRVAIDGSGKTCAAFNYLPFGDVNPDQPSAVGPGFHYLYTGQEFDEEIGLHNYRARLYDARLARFCAPDPAGEYASPYVYVGNNPIVRVDPTGMSALAIVKELGKAAGIGALTGVVTSAISEGIVIGKESQKETVSGWKITERLFIAAGIGAIAGGLGGAAGAGAEMGITGLAFWKWRPKLGGIITHTEVSEAKLRLFGVGKNFMSGAVGGAVGQLTANVADVLQGKGGEVNWGTSMLMSAGIGAAIGASSGWLGATRLSVGEYYTRQVRGTAGKTYEIWKDAERRHYHDEPIKETPGERYGLAIGIGLGLFGDVGNTALTEFGLQT